MNYRINMLPDDLAPEEKPPRPGRFGKVAVLLVLTTGLFIWYGIFLFDLSKMKNELAVLNSRINELSPAHAAVLNTKNELASNQKSVALLEQMIATPENNYSDILADINTVLPVDVWLKNILIMKDGREININESNKAFIKNNAKDKQITMSEPPDILVIEGFARSAPSIGVLSCHLENIRYFSEVSLEEVNYGYGKNALVFKIRAKLREARHVYTKP